MLVISEKLLSRIRQHSENTFPDECTGIIFGLTDMGVRMATEIYPLKNSALNQRTEFAVSEKDLLKAEKRAATNGMDVLGFYHSHPGFEAVASEKDKSFAVPGLSYPIVQVLKGKAAAIKSYAFIDGFEKTNFTEEEIVCL